MSAPTMGLELVDVAGRPVAVLGVDPGASHLGLCLRRGAEVLVGQTVDRQRPPIAAHGDTARWAARCVQAARELVDWAAAQGMLGQDQGVFVAVETVVLPTRPQGGPPVGPRIWGYVAETAVVLGACAGAFPGAWLVPPGGHDMHPSDAYPAVLKRFRPVAWPASGRERSHQRAAHEIAGLGWLAASRLAGGLGAPHLILPTAAAFIAVAPPVGLARAWQTALVDACADLDPKDGGELGARIEALTGDGGEVGPWPGSKALPLAAAVGMVAGALRARAEIGDAGDPPGDATAKGGGSGSGHNDCLAPMVKT